MLNVNPREWGGAFHFKGCGTELTHRSASFCPGLSPKADGAMGQQLLLLSAILGAFALGVLITWSAVHFQVEAYRQQSAAVLHARDDILQYAKALSKLVPQMRAQRSTRHDELDLHRIVGLIKDHLHAVERRVNRLESQEATPCEPIKPSIERGKLPTGQGPILTQSPIQNRRLTIPHALPAPALAPRTIVEQPKPPADLLQRIADIICPDKDRDSIVSFQAEALAVRGPAPALISPPEAPTGPAWERLT